jgi:hypothetical protein
VKNVLLEIKIKEDLKIEKCKIDGRCDLGQWKDP